MSAERPSPAVLEEWIARSWATRPPFTHDCLVEMWREEQRSRAKAQETDYRSQQLDELRRRVAAIERVLGPGGRRLTGDLVAGVGRALDEARAQDRAHILGEVEKRGFVRYSGTWDEDADYARGAMVTHAGSTWIATGPCEKGARPGRAAEWRLAVKG